MAGETLPLNEMGIFPVTDPEVTQCVTYLCNLSFSDVLDVCKNAKFPGGLAVSLSRELLPRLHGHNGHHVPYEATDLLSWISPVERVIPPMQWGGVEGGERGAGKRRATFPTGGGGAGPSVTGQSASTSALPPGVDASQLDFGSALGLFDVGPVLCICASHLDFGSADGLFRIV